MQRKNVSAPTLASSDEDAPKARRAPRTWGAWSRLLYAWLMTPVHASSLGAFRIFYSVCMYQQALNFHHMFDAFRVSKMVFPYPGLGWVAPVGFEMGTFILLVNRISAICTCLGVATRLATPILGVTFTYIFVLCESNHNNHYILICHVTFLASLIDWGAACSVDRWVAVARFRYRCPRDEPPPAVVPYWHLTA